MTIFRFFQDGGRPPSCICVACVRTAHEGHLVVFISVQSLVGIDVVVLIIMHVFRRRELGFKTPIQAPKMGCFGGWPLNGEPCEQNPKRHILARVRVVWAIMRKNPSTGLTCRWVLQSRGINKNNFAEKPPWTDVHRIWLSCRGHRRYDLWQIFGDRLRGVDSVGGRKFLFPIDKTSRG